MRTREALPDPDIHLWRGASGQRYRYTVYMMGTVFSPGPANYILARETRPGQYLPLYIGHTEDLSVPLDDPLVTQCVRQHRATHIHVKLSTAPEEVRRAERSDLIAAWQPGCNSMR